MKFNYFEIYSENSFLKSYFRSFILFIQIVLKNILFSKFILKYTLRQFIFLFFLKFIFPKFILEFIFENLHFIFSEIYSLRNYFSNSSFEILFFWNLFFRKFNYLEDNLVVLKSIFNFILQKITLKFLIVQKDYFANSKFFFVPINKLHCGLIFIKILV